MKNINAGMFSMHFATERIHSASNFVLFLHVNIEKYICVK